MNSSFRNPPRRGDSLANMREWLDDLGRDAGRAVDTSRHSSAIADLRARSSGLLEEAAGMVKRFKIVSVQTNYLTCNPYDWEGNVDTGETVYVAKPPALRDADGERNRTVGSSTVVEEIWTNYAANEDIYAIESSVPTGVVDGSSDPVTWIDQNVDARHWAPKFVEIEGCVESVDKRRMAVVGTVYDPPA